MKRAVITGLLALLFFLLQSTLANYIEIAGISPNLLIILIVSVAFFFRKNSRNADRLFLRVVGRFIFQ